MNRYIPSSSVQQPQLFLKNQQLETSRPNIFPINKACILVVTQTERYLRSNFDLNFLDQIHFVDAFDIIPSACRSLIQTDVQVFRVQ